MFPAWYGSRVAERIVEHATNSHGERFFDELIRDIYDIATSSFGNFVAQTFFEHNLLHDHIDEYYGGWAWMVFLQPCTVLGIIEFLGLS